MAVPPDLTIVVATYGGTEWQDLAAGRAVPSARAQGVPVVVVHGETLYEARNAGLAQVDTEWVVHLDADDELEPGYACRMLEASADLRAPAVRYFREDFGVLTVARMPRVAGHAPHECTGECLPFGNWLIVGAAVRAELVRRVGGWRDWPVFEDWDLWARCWQAGATVEAVPGAVYVAHVRPDSRNRAGTADSRFDVHRSIASDLGLPVPARVTA